MLQFPFPPRRAWLRSFWLVISLLTGLLVGGVLSLTGSEGWGALGAAVLTLGVAVPGVVWPPMVATPYAIWNQLARYVVRAARYGLVSICHYVIFVTVGLTGSSLRLVRPAPSSSQWEPRGTLPPAAYASQYHDVRPESGRQGWMTAYAAWAVHSGQIWALVLLPFLFILSHLETSQGQRFPANIYTLY